MELLKHITAEDIEKYGVVAAPDKLEGDPKANKMVFDRLVREMVAGAFNSAVDVINATMIATDEWGKEEAERVEAELARIAAEDLRAAAENERDTAETARADAETIREENERNRQSRETVRGQAEESRADAEYNREAKEKTRQSQESARATAETSRATAESNRETKEQARQSQEATRQTNEQTRQDKEAERQRQEATRQDNEQTRQTAEQSRASGESARGANEKARAAAEELRVSAETSRTTAENLRASAETNRASAENLRAAAETDRASAEAGRKTAETSRATAESKRETAETNRASAETAREKAEQTRASAETSRTNAENLRKAGEIDRINAENLRVDAEEARVAAEKIREEAYQSRKVVQETGNSTTAVMSQAAVTKELGQLSNEIADYLTPDAYDGTDSEKLQACFDALATSGGVIVINRLYTLTSDVVISHDSSANNNLINVKGAGKNAGISFGSYCFKGVDGASHGAYGGVIFKDLWLTGESVGFDCSNLIRLTFDNCMIRRFTSLVYASDYLQSIYLNGCYVRAALGHTIESAGAIMDVKIIGCVCEAGYGLLKAVTSADGCAVINSCIEGYTGNASGSEAPVILGTNVRAFDFSANYLETNGGTNVDLTGSTGCLSISIRDNLFTEYKDEDEYIGAIKLPASFGDGYARIEGNKASYSYSILVYVPEEATDLGRVYAFGNVGTTNRPAILPMLSPADVLTAVQNPVTEEIKQEIVDDTLAALSGEKWTFTLEDGTEMERVVATATITEFSKEAWVFTLNDGTTVTKEVSVV